MEGVLRKRKFIILTVLFVSVVCFLILMMFKYKSKKQSHEISGKIYIPPMSPKADSFKIHINSSNNVRFITNE